MADEKPPLYLDQMTPDLECRLPFAVFRIAVLDLAEGAAAIRTYEQPRRHSTPPSLTP